MTAAVAIIIRREREIVAIFRGAGATRPDAARTPEDLDIHHRLAFDRLVRRAVLRDAGDGRYYLDEPSWNALRSTRKRLMFVVLIVVLIAFAVSMSTGLLAVKTGIPQLH
ncbi:MAG: hypothetical protein JWM41_4041 [Gemmatimonadetes bacterium]|nr:hypothetical protein [Gemmatimonadota bacterium]